VRPLNKQWLKVEVMLCYIIVQNNIKSSISLEPIILNWINQKTITVS